MHSSPAQVCASVWMKLKRCVYSWVWAFFPCSSSFECTHGMPKVRKAHTWSRHTLDVATHLMSPSSCRNTRCRCRKTWCRNLMSLMSKHLMSKLTCTIRATPFQLWATRKGNMATSVRCSVLWCFAVCCNTLSTLGNTQREYGDISSNLVLQCVAVCCSVLQHTFNFGQHAKGIWRCQCVAVCCSVLQCVAVCCNVSYVCKDIRTYLSYLYMSTDVLARFPRQSAHVRDRETHTHIHAHT